MNRYGLWLGIAGGFLPMAAYGQRTVFPNGIAFDSGENSVIESMSGGILASTSGGILLQAQAEETGYFDGGITMIANPISLVLTTPSDPLNSDRGTFSIWGEAEYWDSTAKPFFQVKSPENIAAFDSVDVTVTNGSLSVGGSPVLTAGGINAALSTATPPTSAAWQAAYVPRGTITGGGGLALGSARASGLSSYANGDYETVASGIHSTAQGMFSKASGILSDSHGLFTTASGNNSRAWGQSSTSSGNYTTAIGLNAEARAFVETVIGAYNQTELPASHNAWINTDALFRVGNGTPSQTSDALTIRKNGEMTVTNKSWKANSSTPLADPAATDDSGGSALVVDGHTTLNGKVTISAAQGDISMGIYQ